MISMTDTSAGDEAHIELVQVAIQPPAKKLYQESSRFALPKLGQRQ